MITAEQARAQSERGLKENPHLEMISQLIDKKSREGAYSICVKFTEEHLELIQATMTRFTDLGFQVTFHTNNFAEQNDLRHWVIISWFKKGIVLS